MSATISIVEVTVKEQIAPAPIRLQETGAIISIGGTNTAPGTLSLLTQPSDFTPLIQLLGISNIQYNYGVVTVTTNTAHGFTIGSTIGILIASCTPTAYNGTVQALVTTNLQFTYPVGANPGTATTLGTYQRVFGILSLSYASGTVTVATNTPHGFTGTVGVAIYNCTPSGYNGYFSCTVTGLSTFTYALGSNPGSATFLGDYYQIFAISSLSWASNVVTVTTSAPHGLSTSNYVAILGAAPSGYNGNYFITVTSSTVFTYVLTSNPGSETTPGFYNQLDGISNLTYALPTVTITTDIPHGIPVGDIQGGTIATVIPTGYNGGYAFTALTTTTLNYTTSMTYPGPATSLGTFSPGVATELLNMVTTFFAQGTTTPVYIFECGAGYAAQTIPILVSYIVANPYNIYIWLCPDEWGNGEGQSSLSNLLLNPYSGNTSKVYFFFPTDIGTYTAYSNNTKAGMALVQSPSAPSTEFSMAAVMWTVLSWNPSNINQVPPLQYTFVTDCTAYPLTGNSVILTELLNANINWIGTGAEGGISNTLIRNGTLLDGNPMNYWYAIDAVQLHVDEDLANEIINGSNNPQNPLYYNQQGINRLQARAEATMNYLISWGLILGPVNVTAVPFAEYVTDNPTDYSAGIYKGLAVIFTPNRGFSNVVFNALVSQFPLGPT